LNKASPVPDEVAMQYTIQRYDRVAVELQDSNNNKTQL
jgi:hypothetical protein